MSDTDSSKASEENSPKEHTSETKIPENTASETKHENTSNTPSISKNPSENSSTVPPNHSGNSNRGPQKEQPQGERKIRTALIIAGCIGAVLVLLQFGNGNRGSVNLRYDEFKNRVRNGEVEEVWIGPETITGRTRKPPEQAAQNNPQNNPQNNSGTQENSQNNIRNNTTNNPQNNNGSSRWGIRSGNEFHTTRVPDDKDLIPLLEQHRVRFSALPDRGGWWMWLLSFAAPLILLVLLWRSMLKRVSSQQGGVLAFGKSKGKIAGDSEVRVRFDDVAGVDEAKEELLEIVEFLRTPQRFTRLGAKIPKGVLLVGPPGTGKTLLAKAVAGEASVPFFSLSGSEFVEMFVGVGAARVRDLFEQAQTQAPCIVFIDELDALGRSRGTNIAGTNEEREQTLNQLLVEMDGFETNKGVIIMGATNRPEVLDPALLRPGRFDRQVLVDRPDKRGREMILRVHARGVVIDAEVDLADVASRTPGFAGADLANVINEAALLAARKNHQTVRSVDISEAIDRVVAGLEKRSKIISPEERLRVAYHEAGHAIVGECVPGAERVMKISIVPRGLAALGYTMNLPTEDRYILTERDLRARLASVLGGRAAERLIFGDYSTGASNDLSQATDVARAMVTDYGMSDQVGPLSLKRMRKANFLGAEGEMGDHGAHLANLVDVEVTKIIRDAELSALEVLRTRKVILEKLAQTLLKKEHLEGIELRTLLDEARNWQEKSAEAETQSP